MSECDREASKNEKALAQQGFRVLGVGEGGTYGRPVNIGLSGEATVFPVEAKKECQSNASIATLSLNLDTTWKLAVKFGPQQICLREITPIPIEKEVGWAPELVSTFWRKKNFFPPAGFDPRTVQPKARSPYIAHVFSFSNYPSVTSVTKHIYHFTN